MSEYFKLCCRECEIALNFGKKIARDDVLELQTFFSELRRDDVSKEESWIALQQFLQNHQGHDLIFDGDYHFNNMQWYEAAEFDALWAQSQGLSLPAPKP